MNIKWRTRVGIGRRDGIGPPGAILVSAVGGYTDGGDRDFTRLAAFGLGSTRTKQGKTTGSIESAEAAEGTEIPRSRLVGIIDNIRVESLEERVGCEGPAEWVGCEVVGAIRSVFNEAGVTKRRRERQGPRVISPFRGAGQRSADHRTGIEEMTSRSEVTHNRNHRHIEARVVQGRRIGKSVISNILLKAGKKSNGLVSLIGNRIIGK